MQIFLIVIAVIAISILALWKLGVLNKDRLGKIRDGAQNLFLKAEQKGLYHRLGAFETDYHKDYPHLSILEDNFDDIRSECLALLEIKDHMPNVEEIGGKHTKGGIHAIKWKSFMFKSGSFIPENCEMAPKTAALIKQVPNVYNAFFSVLDPEQYITPHFGYWKGFVRYHLGIVIPYNNEGEKCWLRINPKIAASPETRHNHKSQLAWIQQGERYHWREGKGVIFDDFNLHDAANESDQIRVVLWLDVARKMPWYLHMLNKVLLGIAYMESSVRRIRSDAKVTKPTG